MKKAILEIQNLKCGGCKNTIEKKLSNLDFIYHAEVNNDNATVSLEYETYSDLKIVKITLARLGYPVIDDINNLRRKAKSYISCAIGKLNAKTSN